MLIDLSCVLENEFQGISVTGHKYRDLISDGEGIEEQGYLESSLSPLDSIMRWSGSRDMTFWKHSILSSSARIRQLPRHDLGAGTGTRSPTLHTPSAP